MHASKLTCAAVEGDNSAFDEYLRLCANAADECLLIGNPTGVPGADPGELAALLRALASLLPPGAVSTLSEGLRCPNAADTRR